MRVERVYDWESDGGLVERDPQSLDPGVQQGKTVRFGILSDTHLGKGTAVERQRELRRWLETFRGLGVEAIVHGGDLVESPDDEQVVEEGFSLLDNTSVPVLGVPGNHDVKEPGQASAVTRRWGPFPRCEEINGVRVSLVDSMAWPPAQKRSQKERELARSSGFFVRGGLGPEQREELADKLRKPWSGAQMLVVHHHLRQPVPAKPWYEENADLMAPLKDAEEVMSLVRKHEIGVVVHGHRHQYVAPFVPFDDVVVLNADSATRQAWPKRARVIDVVTTGEAVRIWELVRFS